MSGNQKVNVLVHLWQANQRLEVAECILHLADGPKGQRADSGGFKILAPIFLMSHIKKWGLHPFPMNPVRLVTVSINRTE